MNKYQLNYYQAQALTKPNATIWFLQGPQIISEHSINMISDIYNKITYLMLGLTPNDTAQVFNALHQNLFGEKFICKNIFSFFLFKLSNPTANNPHNQA